VNRKPENDPFENNLTLNDINPPTVSYRIRDAIKPLLNIGYRSLVALALALEIAGQENLQRTFTDMGTTNRQSASCPPRVPE
jgi:hypothetical protein